MEATAVQSATLCCRRHGILVPGLDALVVLYPYAALVIYIGIHGIGDGSVSRRKDTLVLSRKFLFLQNGDSDRF